MDPRRSAIAISTFAYVLGVAAHTTFLFFLAPTYARARGVPDAEMLAFGVAALASMTTGIAAGRLADRVPRRRVMRLGWALMAAGGAVLAWLPGGVSALVLAAILFGFGLSYGFVGYQSYLADLFRASGLARAYGATGAVSVLGSAAGPLVASFALRSVGLAGAAWFVAALGAAAFVVTIPLHTVRTAEPSRATPAPRVGFATAALYAFDPRQDLREGPPRSAVPYVAAFAVLGLGYGLTVPWMGPHLLDAHLMSPGLLGVVVAAATAVGAGGIYLAGWMGERREDALMLALFANLALAVVLVGFAVAPTLAIAMGLFVARHFVGNPSGAILNAGLVRDAAESERGRALGATNVAWNFLWAFGAFAGGAIRHTADGWLFGIGAFLVVLGPLVGLAIRRNGSVRRRRAQAASRG